MEKNWKINLDYAIIEENRRDIYPPGQSKEASQYNESNESSSHGPHSGEIPPMACIEPAVEVDNVIGTSGETGPPNDWPGSEGSLANRGE